MEEYKVRFLAVIHSWFVHSKGFEVIELKATNMDEAHKEACILKCRYNRPFSSAEVQIIPLEKGDRLLMDYMNILRLKFM